MENLKFCFIGVGSIAKRHIRNLRDISSEIGIKLTIDAVRRNSDSVDGIDHIYSLDSGLPSDYDAIFITNPTDKHLDTLIKYHDYGKNFFIEKPIVSREQIIKAEYFNLKKDSVYYVAAPLRYNSVIQWIKENINPDDVISVRSISSSYLPDWRPGQDYRETYSAHKDMGGGVSIDLIHEWDYLTYLFGWPEKVLSMIGKKSDLEIDSDDYAIYIAEYNDKLVELHLDYFGRKTIREVQLFTREDTIIGDIASNKVTFLKNDKVIDFHEKRDDFQKRELMFFIDKITSLCNYENGYEHALKVLKLTCGSI